MKGYTKQKLTFTKIELIQQLQNWNCNLTDLFDEDKIDIGIKALAFNKLGIDFLFNSDEEFKKKHLLHRPLVVKRNGVRTHLTLAGHTHDPNPGGCASHHAISNRQAAKRLRPKPSEAFLLQASAHSQTS